MLLELALVRYVVDKLGEQGFEPVIPPVLVRERALFGTGFLPDTEQQIYRLADDDLYLTGTSEVALASLHAGEILDADAAAALRRLLALLPARGGRGGQGHARDLPRAPVRQGRDVRLRRARASRADEHERLLAIEEAILQELEIPYRVVNIAVDDLGASAAKKYDFEAWLPGQGRYRELTSMLEHDRLPGPAARRPLPPRGRRAAPACPHAERHGRRRRPHDHRAARERPAGRRQRGAARGAAARGARLRWLRVGERA